jgi:hypothetical protein
MVLCRCPALSSTGEPTPSLLMNVGKDDPLWKEYLDKAAVFDVRMVDELNKIVDSLLVYVGYFLLHSR